MAGQAGPFSRVHIPTPPLQGSFPVDYEAACKEYMLNYLICLSKNENQIHNCRDLSREYLKCRMDNGLMERTEWESLGFHDGPEKTGGGGSS